MAAGRIHITGGPGGGKSTLAKRLAAILDAPVYDLDGLSLAAGYELARPVTAEAVIALMTPQAEALAQQPRWVSEGAYLDWTRPLFERADLVVWMDVPWRVASYRILTRHLKASVARNNRFPGLGNLYRFWRWSSRYYAGANVHGLNVYGTPETRSRLIEELSRHESKLVPCHSQAEIEGLLETLRRSQRAGPA